MMKETSSIFTFWKLFYLFGDPYINLYTHNTRLHEYDNTSHEHEYDIDIACLHVYIYIDLYTYVYILSRYTYITYIYNI